MRIFTPENRELLLRVMDVIPEARELVTDLVMAWEGINEVREEALTERRSANALMAEAAQMKEEAIAELQAAKKTVGEANAMLEDAVKRQRETKAVLLRVIEQHPKGVVQ